MIHYESWMLYIEYVVYYS